MTVDGLTPAARKFLWSLNKKGKEIEDDPGIPVYLRVDDFFFFVEGIKLKTDMNKEFEKKSAEHNLYRGGAVVMIETNINGTDAIIVVPDERHVWGKPIAGIAHHNEGMDLTKAGRRELGEEAFLFTMDANNRKRIVPKGLKDAPRINALGLESAEVVECGEVVISHFAINNDNRALEAVMVWEVDFDEDFSYTHNEDWWQGGHSGIVACAIAKDDQRFLGFFSGQQGFISFPEYNLHPTLLNYLKK